MSIPVELDGLSAAASKHHFGYLITLGDHGRSHVVAVQPRVTGSTVVIGGLGHRSLANTDTHRHVTVLWPPSEPGGYSLIVDGEAEAGADAGSISISPTRAVLHRPAPAPEDTADEACGHDCVELPVTVGSTG